MAVADFHEAIGSVCRMVVMRPPEAGLGPDAGSDPGNVAAMPWGATTVSAIADEIAPDLDTQIATLKRLDIRSLDLRSVESANVLDLSEEALHAVRHKCEEAGLSVRSVASPVNKVYFGSNARREERARFLAAVRAAKAVGAGRIRIFSPEVPRGLHALLWPEVRAWMQDMVDLAQAENLILLHENDAHYYGAYPENAMKLFETFSGPHFKAVFDFANSVLIGFRPFPDWFPWLLPYLDTLHMKDAIEAEKRVVPSGEGDGQIRETLAWLAEQGWTGTLTLEPHLQAAGPYGGFSGPELFEHAANALRKVIAEVGGA